MKGSQVSLQVPFSAVVVDQALPGHFAQVSYRFDLLTFQSELYSLSLGAVTVRKLYNKL